ncbi:DUF1570 domain-containing protein [Allorhodopirellula solitaria]|uniref:DUF1570 domain-containing protein n=1 Tax=Allorhodopirellula solitaria TaxID=2527987 RepID=UPI001FE2D634|nr:DUF1570 domain-containing protein [Allorhodopirellula solitaria]
MSIPPGMRGGSEPPEPPQPAASQPNRPADPSGLLVRMGDLKHPENVRLAVRDDDGNRVVAKYLVGSGDSRVVMMPDGRLKAYEGQLTTPTDDPFEPMSMDEVRDRWLADERLSKLGMKSIQSQRFLFLYNTSEPFIRATRTILETMYPAVRKYFQRTKIPTHEPEFPLVVIAFATDDQYQEFKRMPDGVVAYYDSTLNSISMYEQSRLNRVAPQVAIMNSISTVAHEGVHQILHNIGVQQRLSRWPMWLSEGLPEFFAPTSTGPGAKWKGLGAPNDLRMKEIVEDVKGGQRLGSGRHLERLVQLDEFDSKEYAYSWGVVHWMARKHRDELFACIREASKRQPLEYLTSSQDDDMDSVPLFETQLGGDYADLEQDLSSHLSSLRWTDPVENQIHYLVISGSRVTLTSSPETVQQLQRSTRPLQTFRVQRFPNRTSAMRAMQAITR